VEWISSNEKLQYLKKLFSVRMVQKKHHSIIAAASSVMTVQSILASLH